MIITVLAIYLYLVLSYNVYIMYQEDVFMAQIISRNFRVLCDFMDIYQFMTDIYEKDWRNGVPAPFLEYELSSEWMDKSLVNLCKLWEYH